MPAPFVIAHLQIASLLETAGAPLTDEHRAGVYLTNALTGWVPERHPQSVIFAEFEQEREDSEHIKQQGTILVILGNPPYNGYAGIAKIEEERDLTTAYREPVAGLPPRRARASTISISASSASPSAASSAMPIPAIGRTRHRLLHLQ